MPNTQESLCDLVETRSVQHCMVRQKLWEWVFIAMRDEVILKIDDFALTCELCGDEAWEMQDYRALLALILGSLPAIRIGNDPSKWGWCRNLMISPAAFDKWLNGEKRKRKFPAQPTRRGGANPVGQMRVQAHVDERYKGVVPPGMTNKEIAEGAGVDERTVRRWKGRK